MTEIKKLAAIYNVWADSVELLPYSMASIRSHVDVFIIVWQIKSNFGEECDPRPQMDFLKGYRNVIMRQFTPSIITGTVNEIKKRNIGLERAKTEGCSHFMLIDSDEMYHDFEGAVREYQHRRHSGSACRLFTYFKKPIWRLKHQEKYWVPFIHRLYDNTKVPYPHYNYYCDPTRSVNDVDVQEISHSMHHFSWVRRDIQMKIRNSSAVENIKKGHYLKQYNDPKLEANPEGYRLKDFKDTVTVVDNLFNIPDFARLSL